MKVGFVVECVTEGPETKVIPRLASLVNHAVESEVEPLGSKPKVLRDCGRYAKAMLEKSSCERIVVLWDARPYWDEDSKTNLTIDEQRAKAVASLEAQGLSNDPRVTLVCIIQELEAWLLADGRGITYRINQLRSTSLKSSISDWKHVERVQKPKTEMEKIFRNNKVRSYDHWQDTGHIADGIPKAGRILKNSAVFPQFAAALDDI